MFLPEGVTITSAEPMWTGGISSQRSLGGMEYPVYGNPVLKWRYELDVLNEALLSWNAFAARANRGAQVVLPIATKHRARRLTGVLYEMRDDFPGSTQYDVAQSLGFDREAQGTVSADAVAQALVFDADLPGVMVEAGTWLEVGGRVYQIVDARAQSGTVWELEIDRRLRAALTSGQSIYFDAPRFAGYAMSGVARGSETLGPMVRTSLELTEAVEGYNGAS